MKRLHTNNCFTIPKSTTLAIAEHRKESNPARKFLEEQCTWSPDSQVRTRTVFDAFETWCRRHDLPPGSEQQFGRTVKSVFPKVTHKQQMDGEVRRYYYFGLHLRPGALF